MNIYQAIAMPIYKKNAWEAKQLILFLKFQQENFFFASKVWEDVYFLQAECT